jgi:hypothetical protein
MRSLVSSTTRLVTRTPAEIEAASAKDAAILVLLGKLAVHYWRPDFTPGQARQLYADYVDDLREYALSDINDAMVKYRRNAESKFFPTSGQLVGIIRTIPAWDIRSPKEHSEILHYRAGQELQQVARQIEIGGGPKLLSELPPHEVFHEPD